jgi:hypothetical protein
MANTYAGTVYVSLPLAGSALLRALADNWWLLLLRGIAAIAFGVLAFDWPGLTLLTLTMLWGVYALSDRVFSLWAAISRAATGRVRSRRFRSGLPPPRSAAIRCSARGCRAAPPVGPAVGIQRGSSRNHASCQLCKLRNGNRNHA